MKTHWEVVKVYGSVIWADYTFIIYYITRKMKCSNNYFWLWDYLRSYLEILSSNYYSDISSEGIYIKKCQWCDAKYVSKKIFYYGESELDFQQHALFYNGWVIHLKNMGRHSFHQPFLQSNFSLFYTVYNFSNEYFVDSLPVSGCLTECVMNVVSILKHLVIR